VYKFNHNVLGADDVEMTSDRLQLGEGEVTIDLCLPNPYADIT
jgi:hypothetical protein